MGGRSKQSTRQGIHLFNIETCIRRDSLDPQPSLVNVVGFGGVVQGSLLLIFALITGHTIHYQAKGLISSPLLIDMPCLPLFIEPKAQNITLFTPPLYWTPWYPASKAHYPPLVSWATSLPPCSVTPIQLFQFLTNIILINLWRSKCL